MYNKTDLRGQQKLQVAATLPSMQAFPQTGNYSLIAADPPWTFSLREADKTHRNRTPYPNMKDSEILELGVRNIAAENSYLLLWVTNNHLPLGFRCLEAWGFQYKTIHTWAKMTNDGSKVRIGVGHYGRNCTEHILVGIKGKPGSFTHLGIKDVPNVILAPRGEHSSKPEQFFTLCDRLFEAIGGSRIELFARKRRDNWDAWGLEAPSE